MSREGRADDNVSCPSSWSWTPLVPFERVVGGLRQTAGWLDGYPDPDTYRDGDPEAEQMLAHYDKLLLTAARMLDVADAPWKPTRLTWQERDRLVDALAVRGLHDVAWQW